MPACAALPNTFHQSSVQLFYNTTQKQLGLAIKPAVADSQDTLRSLARSGEVDGILRNPSQLGAAAWYGTNLVAGVVEHTDKEQTGSATTSDICLISPVFRQIANVPLDNTSVAVCADDKGGNAWVYYITGTSPADYKVREYRLNQFSASTLSGPMGLLKGSNLAAYFDPGSKSKDRFVIYQDATSKLLQEHNAERPSTNAIQSSGNALAGTTLAVEYVKGQVYLYYTDNQFLLYSVKKDASGWSAARKIDGAPQVGQSSQVTAVCIDGLMHVYYVADGDEDAGSFTHFTEDVSS